MNQQTEASASSPRSIVSTSDAGGRVRLHWDEWLALILAAIAFVPTVSELVVTQWIGRPEYSHGFLMPLIAAWVIWERRETLVRLQRQDSIVGWLVVAASMVLLLLGEMKLSFFLKPIALVGAILGLIWAFRGWRGVIAFAPALVPLALMCPLPGRVEQALTIPLKNTAALIATGMLNLTGVQATLEGNTIHILGIDSLFMADACSGIRSLISLGSIALLAAVFWPRPWWQRIALVIATIPIAIAINSMRIWLTGVVSVRFGPEMARGFLHFLEGFALFAIAALILLGFAMFLDLCRKLGVER